jgi:hypothetical protein
MNLIISTWQNDLPKSFSTFPVYDSTDTLTHHVVSIVVIAFWYGFASMTFDEVIRNSRSIPNWNWTNNFLSFPKRNRKHFRNNCFFLSRKSIKFSRSGRFYHVGQKRGNKQYFNFGLTCINLTENLLWFFSCNCLDTILEITLLYYIS